MANRPMGMGVARFPHRDVAHIASWNQEKETSSMPDYNDSSRIFIGGEDNFGQVMTSVEAAAYLKMHVKTVCRLAKEGKIPAKKVGSEWRFLRSVLDRWLTESMV
jgi:excisionase family DNA binding protein